MDNYVQGSLVRLSASFTDSNSNPADPTVVTSRVLDPNGVETVNVYPTAIVKDSVGNYHLDVLANVARVWSYRFEGTGAVTAATQGQFNCIASNPS